MNYSTFIDIRKIISLLLLFGLLYISKLFFTDKLFGIRPYGFIIGIYALGVFLLFAWMDKLFFNKKHGYSRIQEAFKPEMLVDKLKAMHPKDFEDFIRLLFELKGYKIIYRSFWKKYFSSWVAHKDGGIDLIAIKDNKKDYVQIKKYITNIVGVETVRAFYGSIVNRLLPNDKAIFITTSIFSEDAEKFSKENNIIIVTYKELEKEIGSIKESEKSQRIDEFLSKIDYYQNSKYNGNIRTCPKCGAPLKRRKEGFYGCQNYYKTGCCYKEYLN